MTALLPLVLLAAFDAPPLPPSVNFRELGHALTRCFQAPPRTEGMQVTVRFSLRRDGSVFGKPRVTYFHPAGSQDDQAAFEKAVASSLDACTPVRVAPDFAAAIAGHPLTILFSSTRQVLSTGGF